MITIAPDGTSAYVTGGDTIWQYSINRATWRLTPLSPATVTAPAHGSLGVAVTP